MRAARTRRLSRPYYVAAAALAAVGSAAALLLVPRERELALISFKGQDFSIARAAFEAQLEAENLPRGVIVPLAEIDVHCGEIERAIDLLERYLAAHPDSADARRRLADYYDQAQRPASRVAMLEALERQSPNVETLREIVDHHAQWNDDAAREAALTRLVRQYGGKAEDVTLLATLLAARGALEEAVAALHARAAQGLDQDGAELLVSLLLDKGLAEAAEAASAVHLQKMPRSDAIIAMAELFLGRGHAAHAARLVAPFEGRFEAEPQLFVEWLAIERQVGRGRSAYERLLAIQAKGPLVPTLDRAFLDLAIEQADWPAAFAAFDRVGPQAVDEDLLLSLVEGALAGRDTARAEALSRRAGEGVLARRPMLAARIAFARGSRAEGEAWVRRAEAAPDLSDRERLALAEHYADTGRAPAAREIARRLALSPQLGVDDLPAIAGVLARAGAAKADVDLFSRLRKDRPSPKADLAWALVASSAGQGAEVRAWLEAAAKDAQDPALLGDLYAVARQAKLNAQALDLARRLDAAAPGPASKLRLAESLMDAGAPADALAILRPMLPGTREVEALHFAALARAFAKGAPVRDELVALAKARMGDARLGADDRAGVASVLVEAGAAEVALPLLQDLARTGDNWFFAFVDAAVKAKRRDQLVAFLKVELQRGDLTPKQRGDRVYALLEQGGHAEALPTLEALAEAQGGDWLFAYEDAAKKAGREGQFLDLLAKRTLRPDVPRAERRDAAFRLLGAGRKADAERLFVALAEGQPATSQDVEQVLYLWGPRPSKAQLDWLESRARAASGAERGDWLERLANVNAHDRIVGLSEQTGVDQLDGAGFLAYAQALAAQRKVDALGHALQARLPRETDPVRLKRMGRLAADFGLFAQAVPAYKKVLARIPDDREALRDGGISAVSDQRYGEARPLLQRFHKVHTGDFESHLAMGDIHAAQGERDAAQFHWGRTVKLVDGDPKPVFFAKVLRAAALQRLNRTEEAIAAFEALRAERPNDADLRVDLAETLLKSKNFDRVRTLIARP